MIDFGDAVGDRSAAEPGLVGEHAAADSGRDGLSNTGTDEASRRRRRCKGVIDDEPKDTRDVGVIEDDIEESRRQINDDHGGNELFRDRGDATDSANQYQST